MSKEFLPKIPKKVEHALEAGILTLVLISCSSGPKPAPAPENSSPATPVPTETATPEPTQRPLEPVPTVVYPTFPPTPAPTPIPLSELPKSGRVITHGPNDGRTVYLTFDDCYGAASNTRSVINTAYTMDARVTFFCIGAAIDNTQQASNMKLAVADGDELENHTYNHASMTTTDVKFMENQMAAQLATVRRDLGDPNYKEYLIRPPFGAGTGNPYFWKAANAEGLRIVTWSFSTGGTDDAYNTSDARIQKIMNIVNANLFDKKGNLIGGKIILEHVRPADMKALPLIIKEVQDKGGRFGLVGDLVGRPMAVNIEPQSKDSSLELAMTPRKDEEPPEKA